MKVINHIRRWLKWRKGNLNGRFYKFLVLIGVRKSPTLKYVWLDSEWRAMAKGFRKGMEDELKYDEPIFLQGYEGKWVTDTSTPISDEK